MTETQTPERLYVQVLPASEVKAGDVVRYPDHGRPGRRRTLSMLVDRVDDCGPVEDPESPRHGSHVWLLQGRGRRLDGTMMERQGHPVRRLTTFWEGQRVDVLRPRTAEELAVVHAGLVTE